MSQDISTCFDSLNEKVYISSNDKEYAKRKASEDSELAKLCSEMARKEEENAKLREEIAKKEQDEIVAKLYTSPMKQSKM